jgi:hypothetical protein
MSDLSLQGSNWQEVLASINVEAPINVIFSGDVLGNANIILSKRLPDGSLQPNNIIIIDTRLNSNISTGSVNSSPQIDVVLQGKVVGVGNAILNNLNSNTITINTTFGADTVQLGVDTFGRYVGNIVAGSGIALFGNDSSENAVVQINVVSSPVITVSLAGDLSGSASATLPNLASNTVTITTTIQSRYLGNILGGNGIAVVGANGTANVVPNVTLAPTGVVAKTYGASNIIPVITVDQWGRISSVSNVEIPGVGGAGSDWLTIVNKPDPQINVILNGDVVGSGNAILADITSNTITITTVIQPDSVALGTDTTGPYVSNLLSGNGITISGLTGEGATPNITLQATGVTAGSYGNATMSPVHTVDQWGRITSSSNVDIILSIVSQTTGAYVQGITNSTGGVSLFGNDGSHGQQVDIRLSPSGVTASTYGNASVSAILTIDTYGRITSASNATITPNWNDVTNKPDPTITITLAGDITGSNVMTLQDLNSNSFTIQTTIAADSVALGTDTTGAYVANLLSGNGVIISGLTGEGATPNITLLATGVTSGTYGNSAAVGTFTVNQWGRITSASTLPIDFNYANVTNRPVANIALTGDIVGSANAILTSSTTLLTISTTIQPDSVALGTDTTGAYVANLLSGNGVIISGLTGEGATPNITLIATGVTAGSYGNSTAVGSFTVDTWGRLSSATVLPIDFNWANITNKPDPTITITLAGDITGSNVMTLQDLASNSFVIQTTIAADSVALGTDTTGAYVANLVQGSGITLTGLTGEGATPTIAANVTSVGTFVGAVSNVNLLNSIKNVGGTGSGLDADLLDGQDSLYYTNYTNITNRPVANIILTGDVTGSANAVLTPTTTLLTIATTIAADSITLGTDTTGAYVANVVGGNGIIVLNNTGGEANVPNITLSATGVTAASYGNSTAVGTFTVNQWGRLTAAASTPIDYNYANVTNRPVANIALTGTITGSANALLTPTTTLLSIATTIAADSVTLGTHTVGPYVANLLSGNGIVLTSLTGESAVPNITLSPTGVTAKTYGASNVVPVFSVDQWGRITSVSNVEIPGVGGAGSDWLTIVNKPDPQINVILTGDVTGSANAILQDVTSNTITITTTIQPDSVVLGTYTTGPYVANLLSGNGVIISGLTGEGAIPNITLQATGVTSGSYGNSTAVGTFTVNQWGRLSSATSTPIDYNYANVTNRPVANIALIGDATGIANAILAPSSTSLVITVTTPNVNQNVTINSSPVFGNVTLTQSGIIDVNSSVSALRVTQRGSGNAILVEDSTNPDATPFVVAADGTVGIGTSTPSHHLTIKEAGVSQIALLKSDGTSNAYIGTFPAFGTASNGDLQLRLDKSGLANIVFGWLGSENTGMRLQSDGTFTLGNVAYTAPGGTKAIIVEAGPVGGSGGGSKLFLNHNYATSLEVFGRFDSTGLKSPLAVPMGFFTNNLERVRIDASGNVGIGQTTPIAKLQVTNSTKNIQTYVNYELSDYGVGVYGIGGTTSVGSGQAIGVWGQASSGNSNVGVYGTNLTTLGQGWLGYLNQGVYGFGPSQGVSISRGVSGLTPGGSANSGVFGQHVRSTSTGHLGYYLSSTDTSYGVFGVGGSANSAFSVGLYGSVTGSVTGSNIAVRAEHQGSGSIGYSAYQGIGLLGQGGTKVSSGASIGVQGQTSGSGNIAVYGICEQSFGYMGYGNTYGVYGSAPAYGVYGSASSYGVYGTTANPTGAGAAGFNTNTGSYGYVGYSIYGVYGEGAYGLYSVGNIYATGDVISASDLRLKSNVVTISNALSTVCNLRGVHYTLKQTGQKKIGMIAQEVQEHVPEVIDAGNEYLGISYPNLVGLLVESIKDLKLANDKLMSQIAELREEIKTITKK